MQKTLDVFNKELGALRTGRANANMLDLIKVDVYGQKMPINQLATITTPELEKIWLNSSTTFSFCFLFNLLLQIKGYALFNLS